MNNKPFTRLRVLNQQTAHMNSENLPKQGKLWLQKYQKARSALAQNNEILDAIEQNENLTKSQLQKAWEDQVNNVTILAPGMV